jgi:hypothetical protein
MSINVVRSSPAGGATLPQQAVVTTVVAITPAVTTKANNGDGVVTNSSGLTTGWVVAIVALILLAIFASFVSYQWYNRRRAMRRAYERERPRPESSYYEISRPERARQATTRFSKYHPRGGGEY